MFDSMFGPALGGPSRRIPAERRPSLSLSVHRGSKSSGIPSYGCVG